MRSPSLASLALVFGTSLSLGLSLAQASSESSAPKHIEIYAWPLSASKPTSLAQVKYNTTTAELERYTAPEISSSAGTTTGGADADGIVRIGFYRDDKWSGIATSSANLIDTTDKKLELLLTEQGEVYHLGFKTVRSAGGAARQEVQPIKGAKGSGLRVEVVPMRAGPRVHLNKPVVIAADGRQEGVEPEKSFIQKYWWVLVGFFVLQLVMAGPKE